MTAVKRNNWFVDYQSMDGKKGVRKLTGRTNFFRTNDFIDSTVLDIGCNIGQMSKFAIENGAKKVFGVDFDQTAIKKADEIFKDDNRLEFRCDDIDEYFFWNSIKPFDVSLFLSIIDTQELTDRFAILSRLCMKTKNVMYFEGHKDQPYQKYMAYLQRYTDFPEIEYLGNINDQAIRAFFRCSRKVYSFSEAKERLINIIHNEEHFKIAIVGEGASGKTHLMKMVTDEIGTDRINIIDDIVRAPVPDRSIYVDYRALLYYSDFDIVFKINAPLKVRNAIRPFFRYDRNVPGLNSKIKRIYHVER